MVKQRFSSADGAAPLLPATCCRHLSRCFDSCENFQGRVGGHYPLRMALPDAPVAVNNSVAPRRAAAVAAEAACLRQRCLGMRVANVYDINPKVCRQQRAACERPAS